MRHNYSFCGAILLLLFPIYTIAQVGIGNDNPSVSSLLDIRDASANDKGVLIPRVNIPNLGNRNPVTTATAADEGLLVYNTNTTTGPGFFYWNGSRWVGIDSGKNWSLSGNSGTVAGTDFIGTTDNVAVQFKTNNFSRFEITSGIDQTNGGRLRAFTNGTATDPIYSWNSNPGTGMFQTANVLGFSTNGTERFRVPNANQVHAMSNGTALLPYYSWQADTNMGMFRIGTDILGLSTNGAERVRIIANGDMGVGANNPDARLDVSMNRNNAPAIYSHITVNNSNWSGGEFYNPNTSGGIGVAGIGFYGVNGAATDYWGWAGYFEGDVGVTGMYYGSDERWKKNIVSLKEENGILRKVMLLKPKSYNWRAEEFPGMGFNPNRTSFGFIAQDLKEIFPELVISKNIPDPKVKRGSNEIITSASGYYMVDYTGLIPILTEALQEQQTIINAQEMRISKLEKVVGELINKN